MSGLRSKEEQKKERKKEWKKEKMPVWKTGIYSIQ